MLQLSGRFTPNPDLAAAQLECPRSIWGAGAATTSALYASQSESRPAEIHPELPFRIRPIAVVSTP